MLQGSLEHVSGSLKKKENKGDFDKLLSILHANVQGGACGLGGGFFFFLFFLSLLSVLI